MGENGRWLRVYEVNVVKGRNDRSSYWNYHMFGCLKLHLQVNVEIELTKYIELGVFSYAPRTDDSILD